MTAAYIVFSSLDCFLRSTGPQPLGRKGNLLERVGRQMHMSLAGVLSPGRMQSFKLESHWVFERTNVGSGKEVFNGLTSQSRPLVLFQVHPSFRTLVGAA